MNPPRPEQAPSLTVLYDGACPLCSREIAWYRGKAATEPIHWQDLSTSEDAPLPCGIARGQALARFHVIEPDGRVVTGARAFIRLWQAFPGMEKFALLARVPPVPHVMEAAYRLFLLFRPLLPRRRTVPDRVADPAAGPDCTIRKQ